MRNLHEPVGIVISVVYSRLPGHRHGTTATSVIISVANRSARTTLGCQTIQAVIAGCDGPGDRVDDLRYAISSVVGVRYRAFVGGTRLSPVADERQPVQGIVGYRGDFVAAICELEKVAHAVILRAFNVQQCVLSRRKPVHAVVGVRGRVVAPIHNRQRIAVFVVRQGGDPTSSVRDFRHQIQAVVFAQGHVAQRIDHNRKSSSAIVEARGRPPEGIGHGN